MVIQGRTADRSVVANASTEVVELQSTTTANQLKVVLLGDTAQTNMYASCEAELILAVPRQSRAKDKKRYIQPNRGRPLKFQKR